MSELDACLPIPKTLIYTYTFAAHMQRRGYPTKLIMEAAIKARRLERNSLLNPIKVVENNQEDQIFLVTTCHPNDKTLRDLVRNNCPILSQKDQTAFLHKKKTHNWI